MAWGLGSTNIKTVSICTLVSGFNQSFDIYLFKKNVRDIGSLWLAVTVLLNKPSTGHGFSLNPSSCTFPLCVPGALASSGGNPGA